MCANEVAEAPHTIGCENNTGHLARDPSASIVLTKCWNWELMLATNFGNPCTKGHHCWSPKFWLPTLVLHQTCKQVNTYWNCSQDWPVETTFFSTGLVPLLVLVATSAGWPLRSLAVSEAVVSASLASLVILLSNDLVLILKQIQTHYSYHHYPLACLTYFRQHNDGLVQERHNSSALAMELHLSCTKPYIIHTVKPLYNTMIFLKILTKDTL